MGIQVSNWNAARADRLDEQATIRALHDEIIAAEAVTQRVLRYRLQFSQGLATATNILFGLEPERALTELECSSLATSHIYYVGRVELPALSRLQATGRLDIVRDPALNAALAGFLQSREALELAIDDDTFLKDLLHLYPEEFNARSTLEPSEFRDGLERSLLATCDLDAVRSNRNLMNDIAYNADSFDSFMRDGLGPWLAQMEEVHRKLDFTLGIQHDEGNS